MSILTRCAPKTALAALMALAMFSLNHNEAEAASKKAAATQGQDAANAAAKKSYEGGVKAYQGGRYQNAVDQLGSALRGGGLSSAEMARGLYYRGLSYRRLNKPGLAISDLTSALWLKNGLSDDERKAASAERAEAYKAAGLGDGNSGADRVAAADPKSETPTPAAASSASSTPADAAAPTTQHTSIAPAAAAGGVPQPLTMGAETAAVPPPPTTARQTTSTIDQSAALQEMAPASGAAQPMFNAAPSGGNNEASQTTSPGGGNAIAGFFSNLFSGGSASSAPSAEPSPNGVTTASTSQGMSQTSSWSDSTSLTRGSAKPAPASSPASKKPVTAVSAPAPQKAVKAAAKGGKYKLHIAALRSRAAAEALAQKLMQEHAGDFHDRQPSVDEAVIGSMGTFYRVRVGSYQTADEPRGLCNALRNSGYDCLVVSN